MIAYKKSDIRKITKKCSVVTVACKMLNFFVGQTNGWYIHLDYFHISSKTCAGLCVTGVQSLQTCQLTLFKFCRRALVVVILNLDEVELDRLLTFC